MCNKLFGDSKNIVGVEQTSSGDTSIVENNIRYDVMSIARWFEKQTHEAPHIGEHAVERILRHIEQRKKQSPKILVLGLGTIGRQVAGRLLVGNIGTLRAADAFKKLLGPGAKNPLRNAAAGFLMRSNALIPLTAALDTIGEYDVIIGASGSRLFDEDMLESLHPEVSLISVSSSDREFPALAFRRGQEGNIHDDYYLDERCLVNGGFPITFYGNRFEVEPRKIEITIALLQMAVLHAAKPMDIVPHVRSRILDAWLDQT